MAVLLTPPVLQFFDNNGDPLAGGKLYTYIAGTTTPKQTFTDASEAVAAPNPIVLDAAGRAVVWIAGSYRFVLEDALGNVIRTVDNVTSFNVTPAASPSFFQSFSGNGTQNVFNLSQDLGTDENSIMLFVNNGGTAGPLNSPDYEVFSGNGSQTAFTLTQNLGTDPKAFMVFVNDNTKGWEVKAPTTDYTVNGTTLTFVVAPPNAASNVRVYAIDTGPGFEIQNPATYTLSGMTLTLATPPKTGTNNIMVFAPSLLLGAASAAAAAAEASANAAAVSEMNAAASAVLSAQQAASLTGTSATSVLIGTGSKSFTTQTNKNFNLGAWLVVASAANVGNYMFGQVTAYNSGTGSLTINVPAVLNTTGGTGTYSDWIISVAGIQGIQGQVGTGVADMKNQTFTGVSGLTTLTITNTPIAASANALFVVFNNTLQPNTDWSYNPTTGVITFNSAIPSGIDQVFTFWFSNVAVGTPTDGTVTFPKFASGVVNTSTTLVGASNTNIPSTTAIKTYSDNTFAIKSVVGTAQNTTSGTSVDFTGLPAAIKRINVMFSGVSTTGTSGVLFQLGTSGGIDATGYLGTCSVTLVSSVSSASNVTGISLDFGAVSTAATLRGGILTLVRVTGNTWAFTAIAGQSNTTVTVNSSGSKVLSADLDRIRLTTVGGTDTFDAGVVNLIYEV